MHVLLCDENVTLIALQVHQRHAVFSAGVVPSHACVCLCDTSAAYVALLLLNVVGSLSYFIASMQHGVSNESGMTFGVSILLLGLFVPCSFVCWFRPVYNAFQ